MEKSDKQEQRKNKFTEIKTYPVPFASEEIARDITFTTNIPSKPSKEEIISQALKLHSEGRIQKAAKVYQYFIDQGFKDHSIFSNFGIILKGMGKVNEAESLIQKAIELKPDYANAYSILGNILIDQGKLNEAEISINKAINLDPKEITYLRQLIFLLTIYQPKDISSNRLYLINEEYKKISFYKNINQFITDEEAIKLYNDGFEIYKKYNLDLRTSLYQIHRSNDISLNCRRHKLIFNQHKIIPEFCFGCYKVQVEIDSIIELIKLLFVFNNLKLKNNNTRKCMIEIRPKVLGFYKGLIYCSSLNEALEISNQVNFVTQNYIRKNLISKVKRGCSEYPEEFPTYKEIKLSGDQPMKYNENWRTIEEEIDKSNRFWGKTNRSLGGFTLNDFLIMRNWIAYAQKIGDQSVRKITNEKINADQIINSLTREINI